VRQDKHEDKQDDNDVGSRPSARRNGGLGPQLQARRVWRPG
jgi:hypothetical protein